jgi:hypothetical protein
VFGKADPNSDERDGLNLGLTYAARNLLVSQASNEKMRDVAFAVRPKAYAEGRRLAAAGMTLHAEEMSPEIARALQDSIDGKRPQI